jgi:hypothetical protein
MTHTLFAPTCIPLNLNNPPAAKQNFAHAQSGTRVENCFVYNSFQSLSAGSF